MEELTKIVIILKQLVNLDTLFISQENIDNDEWKKIMLYNCDYYLYFSSNTSYNVIYCIKQIVEAFLKYYSDNKESEDYLSYFTTLAKQLLSTTEINFDENDTEIQNLGLTNLSMDCAIIKNDVVIYNKNIDKFVLDTSILKLENLDEFSMLVKNGEVFGYKTKFYKVVLSSDYLIEGIIKLALKVKLTFFSKIFENELYIKEFKCMNEQLEKIVKQRTIEIENKSKLLEEEKNKLNEANQRLTELNIHFDNLSRTDPLTRLSNRRDLQGKYESEMKKLKSRPISFALIIGDIDFFKSINDTYGHECGDQTLIKVANIFKKNFRDEDVISRYGGEEFVIFLTEVNNKYSYMATERIRSIIENEIFEFEGKTFHITMSFGLFNFDKEIELDKCIRRADEALYEAKTIGRNRIVAIG